MLNRNFGTSSVIEGLSNECLAKESLLTKLFIYRNDQSDLLLNLKLREVYYLTLF